MIRCGLHIWMLYLKNKYDPPLTSDPATAIETSIVATVVEPLRRRNCNGIYEATMIHTTQADGRRGPNGYFGVQGGHSTVLGQLVLRLGFWLTVPVCIKEFAVGWVDLQTSV